MKIENYIFDFDGTLINSQKDVFLSFQKAFEKVDYPIDKTRLNPDIIGPPLREIIKLIAPELTDDKFIDKICSIFREIYDNDPNDNTFMYNGVFDYLTKLKENKKRIFMATFKPMTPTLMLVKKMGIEKFFDDIYGIDKFEKNITKDEMIKNIIDKYKLNKQETVMIGDAATDMIAAHKAGINGIGVLWGYGQDKTPLTKNADYVIKNIYELDEIKI